MLNPIEDFPNIEAIAAAVADLEDVPADFDQLTAAVNAIWSYLARVPSADQWTALVSIALDLGADSIGTSQFMRRFNIGDDPCAARLYANFGGDSARRAAELAMLFP